jgi:two-component system sensor histidine kinase KdpD
VLLGVVAWRPADPEGLGLDEERLINVLVDVGSAAIVRARLAGAQAEVAALARTEQLHQALLSSISHDLRTPLAAIIASASSLKEFGERFDPAIRNDLVETIEEEADRLNRFVSNLLNMTRLESGALAFNGEATPTAEVVDRVQTRLHRRLGAGKRLTATCDEQVQVFVDPILLEQAIANVAENAVRFSPLDGAVTMDVRRRDDQVIVEVSDEGPGVPEADLTRIFEKFYRSPASSETLQGTGLGLSIARGLVESMGGAISAGPRHDGRSGLTVTIVLKAWTA